MNAAMLVGCIVCFSCIFLNGVDEKFVAKDSLSFFCHVSLYVTLDNNVLNILQLPQLYFFESALLKSLFWDGDLSIECFCTVLSKKASL